MGAGSRQQAVSAQRPKMPAVAVYGVALGRPDIERVSSSIVLEGRPNIKFETGLGLCAVCLYLALCAMRMSQPPGF